MKAVHIFSLAALTVMSAPAFAFDSYEELLSADELTQLVGQTDADADAVELADPGHRHPHSHRYVCYSTDYRGRSYTGYAFNAHQAQNEARYRCESHSRARCYDRGCEVDYGRRGD